MGEHVAGGIQITHTRLPGNSHRKADARGGNGSGGATLQHAHWAAVGKLTPGLIHEINNILCVISNYIELLALHSERGVGGISRSLEAMSGSIGQARALTHRFGAYARAGDRFPYLLCANDIVENAIALLKLQKAFREITIHREFSRDLPEVEGDPCRLMDAVVELLTAAVPLIPRGGAFTISTRVTPGWILIGFTGDGEWCQSSEGSLSVVRQLVEQQGGQLICECGPEPAPGIWMAFPQRECLVLRRRGEMENGHGGDERIDEW